MCNYKKGNNRQCMTLPLVKYNTCCLVQAWGLLLPNDIRSVLIIIVNNMLGNSVGDFVQLSKGNLQAVSNENCRRNLGTVLHRHYGEVFGQWWRHTLHEIHLYKLPIMSDYCPMIHLSIEALMKIGRCFLLSSCDTFRSMSW